MILCSVTVSKSEQLHEDGQVGPKHTANYVILCQFKLKRDSEQF
jgi:hypothetical protein